MMRPLVALVAASIVAACAPMSTSKAPASAASQPAASCDARALSAEVGRPYTAALGAELQRRSGTRTLRVIRPGMMVTMDFREDRLTLRIDTNGR